MLWSDRPRRISFRLRRRRIARLGRIAGGRAWCGGSRRRPLRRWKVGGRWIIRFVAVHEGRKQVSVSHRGSSSLHSEDVAASWFGPAGSCLRPRRDGWFRVRSRIRWWIRIGDGNRIGRILHRGTPLTCFVSQNATSHLFPLSLNPADPIEKLSASPQERRRPQPLHDSLRCDQQ